MASRALLDGTKMRIALNEKQEAVGIKAALIEVMRCW